MTQSNLYSFSQPFLMEKPSTLLGTMRNLVSTTIAPFQQDYINWPWNKIGATVIVFIGSYTLYKYLPRSYRRYFLSSTKKFSQRYNRVLHLEKEALFSELTKVKTREEGRKLQVLEIGVANGANMPYYPPHVVEVICVEPVREFVPYLTETLQQNPHVKCRELLVGNAENISVIRNNQVDAVVSTLTLSSCNDIDQVLSEIRRILKPVSINEATIIQVISSTIIKHDHIEVVKSAGYETVYLPSHIRSSTGGGVFIYMENIRSSNSLFALIQYICSPVYRLLFGISLVRNIPEHIERAHFNGGIAQHIFTAHGIPFLLSPHVSGVARK